MLTPDKYDLSGLTADNIEQYGVCVASTFGGRTGTSYVSYEGIQSVRYSHNTFSFEEYKAKYHTANVNSAIENLKYKVGRIYEIAQQIKCWPAVMDTICYKLNNKGDVSKIQWYAAFDGKNMYLYGEVTRQLQYGQSKIGVEVFIKANNKVLVKMCQRQKALKNV